MLPYRDSINSTLVCTAHGKYIVNFAMMVMRPDGREHLNQPATTARNNNRAHLSQQSSAVNGARSMENA